MKHFSHDNIVQLYGVCTTNEPVYIVMELMIHGDLKSFLLARRRIINQQGTPEAEEVTPGNLTRMALDIARGLQYLAQLKYVHRDLALRNCMVGLGNVIKIGDFGLARQLNLKDYYRFERKAALPIRWMAPEAITEGLFTTQSDVWSYGVTLWELATFGGFPYQGVSNQEVLDYVKEGNRLKIPERSPESMASLLRFCWRFDYLDRPTPYRIVQILTENPELVHACVEVPSSTVTDDCVGKFHAPRTTAHARNRSRSNSVSSQMSERIRTSSLLKGSSVSSKQNIAISSVGMHSPGTKSKNSETVERKTSFFFRL
ncbi:insulin-like growth factor 1 receptor [Actinia tenebrosa]|uniref:Insulin-like growth factor 1 receptor n=1 Tax=Actinia tenebrosa TaxID=6105 RepID=A0A6P8HQZ5_ACTTE|nr:insulin-like growth factor 1 receptor [Actinia tenebrosa]